MCLRKVTKIFMLFYIHSRMFHCCFSFISTMTSMWAGLGSKLVGAVRYIKWAAFIYWYMELSSLNSSNSIRHDLKKLSVVQPERGYFSAILHKKNDLRLH